MDIRKTVLIGTVILLTACSSQQNDSDFDESLYSGKPVESLTSDAPPATEEEAIQRGDAALNNNNIDLALYEYIRSLAFPNAQHKDKTLYTVGKIHLVRENYELADRSFRASLAENPDHIGSLAELGKLNTKQGKKEIGQSYYLRAINADQIRLGGDPNLTKDAVSKESVAGLRFDESSPSESYVGLGVLADVRGNHETAQALLRKAVEIDNRNVNALVSLGYSYYMTEDYFRATHFTSAALSVSPSNERAINNLGLISLAKGQPRQALSIFNKHMSESEALNNVGYFLILQGKPDEAIPYLQQAINKNPSYYEMANKNLERALAMVREGTDTSTVVF
ncbi:tetratricopeptide repeat protein [Vibrio sp. SCSIO 43153]|uniref:tetratricopeptide repeat protein n=1 Tax=Vibrio sp. SCSIO 43153 TaxID=2819098 RepID=UPI002075F7E1|nr:tetratricopeptide repeat protein [Vibrio sp. SCSIO 43153]USD49414.1 tetratricopeptide repeat protein [Vibrio sp. SCSIO 43153]